MIRESSGAVQGLLDRQHGRIGGRGLQQVEHRAEAFEGVVQQHVALAQGLERRVRVQVGRPRGERRELQVGAIGEVVHLGHPVEVDRPVDLVDRARFELEMLEQGIDDAARAVLGDFQAHGGAEAAAEQLALERAGEVFDFLLVHEQFRIPRDPELVGAAHLQAGEQVVHEGGEQGRQEHEVVLAAGHRFGQLDDPGQ